MPNWTDNTIYFRNEEDFKEAKKYMVSLDKDLNEHVDFEIISPVPKSLNIECSSLTSDIEKASSFDELSEDNKNLLMRKANEIMNNNLESFEKDFIANLKKSENSEDRENITQRIFDAYKKVIAFNK